MLLSVISQSGVGSNRFSALCDEISTLGHAVGCLSVASKKSTDEKHIASTLSSDSHEDGALLRCVPEYLAAAALLRAVHAYHRPVTGTSVLALSRQAMAAVRDLVTPRVIAPAGPSTPPRSTATAKAKTRTVISAAATKTPRRAASKASTATAPPVRAKGRATELPSASAGPSRRAPVQRSVGRETVKQPDIEGSWALENASEMSRTLGECLLGHGGLIPDFQAHCPRCSACWVTSWPR